MLRRISPSTRSLWLVTITVITLGCRKTNVLLITIDSLRADRLSCYGYRGRQTPHIDRLATDGILFEQAFCDVPWTTPSLASVLTGTYATIHGVKSIDVHGLGDDAITLAEVLRAHDYHTAAVVGSFLADHIFGLAQGFDTYDDAFTRPMLIGGDAPVRHVPSIFHRPSSDQRTFNDLKMRNDSRRSDAEVTSAAITWLRKGSQRPFFLWVHYFGPQAVPDVRRSDAENLAEQVDGYDARLAETDRAIGELLETVNDLGFTADTLVVLHADHGESLGEHGAVGHGTDLYEPALRIPLIMRLPGKRQAGVRVAKLARNVDIFATALDMLHIPVDHLLSGKSLLPLALDPSNGGSLRATYMETYYSAHGLDAAAVTLPDGSNLPVRVARQGIRGERWKYVRTEPCPLCFLETTAAQIPKAIQDSLRSDELYDLAVDPSEGTNLAAVHPEVVSAFRARLDQYFGTSSPSTSSTRTATRSRPLPGARPL